MKNYIKKIPIIGKIATKVYRNWIMKQKEFKGSNNYWKERYKNGGNSGEGSYGALAEFKAEIINNFVKDNKIKSVIELGCGDGNQLSLAKYPKYVGFDISQKAISLCKEKYNKDETKEFKLMNEYNNEVAELSLSLDVIYHLIEDDIFENYMNNLFNSSEKFVIIYSSDLEETKGKYLPHIKHRKFSLWIKEKKKEWKLLKHIPNIYKIIRNNQVDTNADFFIYEKINYLSN